MSTKFTLDHGEDHHFYLDIFESGKVYLNLIGADFEARPGRVTVAIPLELWERLRVVPIDKRACLWDEDDVSSATSPASPGPDGA